MRLGDPEAFAEAQRELCEGLGLLGRILVAAEGINGTVSGETEATEEYMRVMRAWPATADMEFKIDAAGGHAFKKLSIKVRDELVALNLEGGEDIDPNELSGDRLSPAQFREAMRAGDAILLDGRNDYESELGRFHGAICPPVKHFRDFPQWIRENLEDAKDKPVLTYCTGGIRCEKLSGFLLKEGFKSVAQLDGGIVSYGKDPETSGEDFEGRCYVFDSRISVPVNRANPKVVARCRCCGEPSERYVNCAHKPCNAKIFLCESCEAAGGRYCGEACRTAGPAVSSG